MNGGQIMPFNFNYTYALLPGLLSNGKTIGISKLNCVQIISIRLSAKNTFGLALMLCYQPCNNNKQWPRSQTHSIQLFSCTIDCGLHTANHPVAHDENLAEHIVGLLGCGANVKKNWNDNTDRDWFHFSIK